jgi:hypothetical protein
MSFGVAPWWAWALIYAAVLIVTMLWTGADRLAKLEGKKDQR